MAENFVTGVADIPDLPISMILGFLNARDLSALQDIRNRRLYDFAEDELIRREKEMKCVHKHQSCASACSNRLVRWELAEDFVNKMKPNAVPRKNARKKLWQEITQNKLWQGCKGITSVEDISAPLKATPSVEVFVRISLSKDPEAKPLYQGFVPILDQNMPYKESREFYTYIAIYIYGLELDMQTRKSLKPLKRDIAKRRLERLFEALERPEDIKQTEVIDVTIVKVTQTSRTDCKHTLLVSTTGLQLKTHSGGDVFCYFLKNGNAHPDKANADCISPLFFFEGSVPPGITRLIETMNPRIRTS